MKATQSDVAREAGVSSATVDRVLNDRPGVRRRTREIVMDAAIRLGYVADPLVPRVSRPADVASMRMRLDFVLPMGTNSFIRNLGQQLAQQGAARPGVELHTHLIEGFNPDTLAAKLQELHGQTQGVGIIALDHPTVREAIRALAASGAKVVTLASDISSVPRIAYVGIDNRQAGRLAGYVLGRLVNSQQPRKIALLAGSLAYRGHEEREMGFRHVLAEDYPNLQIVELREVRDDREKAFAETSAVLDRHDDLAAIYNIGAGNAGVGRALKQRNRQRSVIFIAHEFTDSSKALLLDGTIDAIIDQNPRVEARETLNLLCNSIRGLPIDYHGPRLQIIFRENIPEH